MGSWKIIDIFHSRDAERNSRGDRGSGRGAAGHTHIHRDITEGHGGQDETKDPRKVVTCVGCGKPVNPPRIKFCSKICRRRERWYRLYHRRIYMGYPSRARWLARNRANAIKWREKQKREGRCVRCGHEKDREETKLCSSCITYLRRRMV